jgi:hypothetical protein
MTNNKQQTAVEWLAEQMEILHYDYFTEHISKDEKNQRLKQLKEQAREMYQDEIEAAAIISSAEQSTSAASANTEAFGIGYDQGYNRALDLVEWKINNELKNTK